jgi:antitoxin ParD1/3/4
MRTNIDIDDKLMQAAMKAGGFKTKKETVEAALQLLARQKAAYKKLLRLGGKLQWEGSLDDMRRSRFPDWS